MPGQPKNRNVPGCKYEMFQMETTYKRVKRLARVMVKVGFNCKASEWNLDAKCGKESELPLVLEKVSTRALLIKLSNSTGRLTVLTRLSVSIE